MYSPPPSSPPFSPRPDARSNVGRRCSCASLPFPLFLFFPFSPPDAQEKDTAPFPPSPLRTLFSTPLRNRNMGRFAFSPSLSPSPNLFSNELQNIVGKKKMNGTFSSPFLPPHPPIQPGRNCGDINFPSPSPPFLFFSLSPRAQAFFSTHSIYKTIHPGVSRSQTARGSEVPWQSSLPSPLFFSPCSVFRAAFPMRTSPLFSYLLPWNMPPSSDIAWMQGTSIHDREQVFLSLFFFSFSFPPLHPPPNANTLVEEVRRRRQTDPFPLFSSPPCLVMADSPLIPAWKSRCGQPGSASPFLFPLSLLFL